MQPPQDQFSAFRQQAWEASRNADWQEANQILETIIAGMPQDVWSYRMLAYTVEQQSGYRASAEILARAVTHNPGDHDLKYLHALAVQKSGDADACAPLYEAVLAVNPAHGQAWWGLGMARFAMGDVAAAVAAYRKAVEFVLDSLRLKINLAHALAHDLRFDEAWQIYRDSVAAHPDDMGFCLKFALDLALFGWFDEARDQFQSVLLLDSTCTDAIMGLGRISLALGEWQDAAGWFASVPHYDRRYEQATIYQGYACWLSANRDQAQECWQTVWNGRNLALQKQADRHLLSAKTNHSAQVKEFQFEDPMSDRRRYDQAGRDDGTSEILSAARDAELAGDFCLAMKLASEYIAVKPNMSRGYHYHAYLLQGCGRGEETYEQLLQGFRVYPWNLDLRLDLAQVCYCMRDHAAAMRHARGVLYAQPTMWRAHELIACIHMASGRLREAADSLMAALQLNPGSLECRLRLGEVLTALGQHEDAITVISKLDSSLSHYSCVRIALVNAYLAAGRDEEARIAIRPLLSPCQPEHLPTSGITQDTIPNLATLLRQEQEALQNMDAHQDQDPAR